MRLHGPSDVAAWAGKSTLGGIAHPAVGALTLRASPKSNRYNAHSVQSLVAWMI